MKSRLWPLLLFIVAFSTQAEETSPIQDNYGYYGLEPEIITNYITTGRQLGYIRVTVELMLKDASTMALVEHHAPLIRSTIIEILGEQPAEKIKSLAGREEIRRQCYDKITTLLEEETGKDLISNLLFTKYLYS
ncbi:flagellar basal body-associated protein FliL [Ferrimonas lipolytica]|uniref:Flagellar protein FliL n=1 Tax=Ferrimonas lipolytica TaxID=2724191 RepID=A0A6H1UGY7_9GAMM|nr:flagellar basal body-associated protein FliL [Ferrimonas lipolytica]QIZ78367.1 flagellar basal body-associated protein FliL [Ferrimonas lipolytica]